MAKCKKCDKEVKEGSEYCSSCEEKSNRKKKNVVKAIASLIVVVAGAIFMWNKKDEA